MVGIGGLTRVVNHIPFRPLQDADDPAAATRYVPVDHGSYRVSAGQVQRRTAGPAGRIRLHATISEVAEDGLRGGVSERGSSQRFPRFHPRARVYALKEN